MSRKGTQAGGEIVKRVLLVDDHPMMREGLAQLINHEQDLEVCGESESAAQALEAADRLKPDLVLVDISLPDRSGLELIKDLHLRHPATLVLVISMHDENVYAERVLRAGGRGYIMKQEGGKRLMQAIRQVLGGQIYVSERMSARLLESFSGRRPEGSRSPVDRLTDREFEVLGLIGKGKGTREIASQLHLSARTVEVHRLNIKTKLELKTSAELIRFAVQWVETQNGAGGE
jgi:DNA-binding NarL/FixJ family response regulator